MVLKELTVKDFADALASNAPVPGGGGAAALIGALGVALCSMAGNFTSGKKKYVDVQADIERMLETGESLRAGLIDLIDEDAKGFEPLSKAYSLPKDTPGYKDIMTEATLNACRAPFAMMEKSCAVIDLLEEMAEKGSKMMISDVGCGASAARAALESAAMNVFINTSSLPDDSAAQEMAKEAEEMLAAYIPKAEKIAGDILAKLKGEA